MARAWLDAGMVEDAKETLDALRRHDPGRHTIVEGRNVPLFGETEDPLKWLAALIGPEDVTDSSESEHWQLHGGVPQRWTTCPGWETHDEQPLARPLDGVSKG